MISASGEPANNPAVPTAVQLQVFHDTLLAAYGPQRWWPADTRFEILVGAVLVQRTTWSSAAVAITRLRQDDALTARTILCHADLANAIRVAGPHRIKARRLRNLCQWFVGNGGFAALDRQATIVLRRSLLDVHGIGPETADVILLYAFERPVFVADAYAFRIFRRYGWYEGKDDYARMHRQIGAAAPDDAAFFNELHALIVAHAKHVCHKRTPDCAQCALAATCPASHVHHA